MTIGSLGSNGQKEVGVILLLIYSNPHGMIYANQDQLTSKGKSHE